MFDWLRGRKKEIATAAPARELRYAQLESMSFAEIIAAIEGWGQSPWTLNVLLDLSRRLIEITYLDESVDMDDRGKAHKLELVIWAQLEDAAKDSTEYLQACRAARDELLRRSRTVGVFSLAHKIQSVDAGVVVSEIVKPENTALLKDFPREFVESHRGAVLRELLFDRAKQEVQQPWAKDDVGAVSSLKIANAVMAAGWLVLTRETTALWILTGEERVSIGRVLDDYEQARKVLLQLGVIEDGIRLDLNPEPEAKLVNGLVLQSCADGAIRSAASEAPRYRERLKDLSPEAREEVMVLVVGVRMVMWKKILCSLYGQDYFERVKASVTDTKWPEASAELLKKMESLYELALSEDPNGAGLHTLIVAVFVLEILERVSPQSRTDAVVQACGSIFSSELFHFPNYAKFLLWFLIHGKSSASSTMAMTEDALDWSSVT